jgi:hypothetical protein
MKVFTPLGVLLGAAIALGPFAPEELSGATPSGLTQTQAEVASR